MGKLAIIDCAAQSLSKNLHRKRIPMLTILYIHLPSSNVLEVFIAPVLHVTDNPEWYFELDASPSGAMVRSAESLRCTHSHNSPPTRHFISGEA